MSHNNECCDGGGDKPESKPYRYKFAWEGYGKSHLNSHHYNPNIKIDTKDEIRIKQLEGVINKLKDDLALEKSISKWGDIFAGVGADFAAANCELCKRNNKGVVSGCKSCVVAKKTGKGSCFGTPYAEWAEHHRLVHKNSGGDVKGRKVECPECAVIALREWNLLKSLRFKGYVPFEKMKFHVRDFRPEHVDFSVGNIS